MNDKTMRQMLKETLQAVLQMDNIIKEGIMKKLDAMNTNGQHSDNGIGALYEIDAQMQLFRTEMAIKYEDLDKRISGLYDLYEQVTDAMAQTENQLARVRAEQRETQRMIDACKRSQQAEDNVVVFGEDETGQCWECREIAPGPRNSNGRTVTEWHPTTGSEDADDYNAMVASDVAAYIAEDEADLHLAGEQLMDAAGNAMVYIDCRLASDDNRGHQVRQALQTAINRWGKAAASHERPI